MMIVDLEDTVGWIGCAITTCYYIPQMGSFIKVMQNKINFEEAPGFFISISYLNCFLWMIYGDQIFSDTVRTTFLIASFICLFNMIVYIIYEAKKYLMDAILNFLIIFMASWSIYKYLTIEVDDDKVVGSICLVTSTILYSYFGYIIYKVINEKNFMLIHFNTTSIYFVSSLLWFTYGIVIKDLFMLITYTAGSILSLIEIIIYINYEKKYPAISTNDADTQGTESNKKEDKEEKEEKEEEIKNIDDNNKLEKLEKLENSKSKPVKILDKFES